MSKHLADLLGNDHPLFRLNLAELERSSGSSGVDARLLADSIEAAHTIMRKLGLDTADSSAKELYLALNSAALREDAQVLFAGAEFVLLNIDGEVVSFNTYDVIENAHHELLFEDRHFDHAQRNLRLEVVKRYAEHERTDDQTVHTLTKEVNIHMQDDQNYNEIDALVKEIKTDASNESSDAPYVLAIGDIFTDAFIKLNEDVARIDEDESGEKRLSLPFGSKPPYDEVEIVKAVGPAPNAAVAIARLGLSAGLDSFIGDDEVGREALDYLKTEKVDTSTMLVEKGLKTSYYFVLRYGPERTILVKNEQFEYTWTAPTKTPEWIYLALISDDSWGFHEGLADYLEANPNVKLAFQPGTFHFKWGAEKLKRIYARSEIIVLNREEAVDITGRSYDSLRDLAAGLHELGPKIVVITDGPSGSYASYDGKLVTIPNYPDSGPLVDRTGAGDAFASTIVTALAKGESMETALLWAPINSMNVVQQLGAQAGLQTQAQIAEWLEKAPEEYRVTELSE